MEIVTIYKFRLGKEKDVFITEEHRLGNQFWLPDGKGWRTVKNYTAIEIEKPSELDNYFLIYDAFCKYGKEVAQTHFITQNASPRISADFVTAVRLVEKVKSLNLSVSDSELKLIPINFRLLWFGVFVIDILELDRQYEDKIRDGESLKDCMARYWSADMLQLLGALMS